MQQSSINEPAKDMFLNRKVFILILLTIVTLSVYWKASSLDFVIYDDPGYVTQNRHVVQGLSLENIRWAFTTIDMSNWHPITWISYLIDGRLYGLNPQGYHITNIFLHIANTLLLFLFLNRTTGSLWRSAFVAALFALHPLHVESVAWVSERKDVLSTLFFMLSLLAYSSYAQRPRPAQYLLVMIAFSLSLMSKPMFVTFPFILLLLDYWPLKRLSAGQQASRLVLEKIPFALMSAGSIIITIYAQYAGEAMASVEKVPIIPRVENALVAYASYIIKMLWPTGLAALYPISTQVPILQVCGALFLLCFISVIAYRKRAQHPFIIVGWLWFLGTLVPVIGLIQVGSQSMADRYTYVPLIGLFMMIAWGGHTAAARYRHGKKALVASACFVAAGLSVLTWLQIGHWKNSVELFTHTLKHTSGNYVMHNNLGICLADQGDYGGAISQFEKALAIAPNYKRSHYNLGNSLLALGEIEASVKQYQEALRIDPDYVKARYNLGAALTYAGRHDESISQYYEVLKLSPNFEDARKLLGIQLACQGRFDEAIMQFSEILKRNPGADDAHFDLSVVFASQGRTEEAIMHLSKALHKKPFDDMVIYEVRKYSRLAKNTTQYGYLRNILR
jgi:tetratricopeptide (TPR) repeat protein